VYVYASKGAGCWGAQSAWRHRLHAHSTLPRRVQAALLVC
jgi:hypothetical protein